GSSPGARSAEQCGRSCRDRGGSSNDEVIEPRLKRSGRFGKDSGSQGQPALAIGRVLNGGELNTVDRNRDRGSRTRQLETVHILSTTDGRRRDLRREEDFSVVVHPAQLHLATMGVQQSSVGRSGIGLPAAGTDVV